MDKTNFDFYAYSWHVDEECQDETFIRVYGLNDQNENICVSVNGFRPFVWVELPTYIDWKNNENKGRLYQYFRQTFPGIKCSLKFYRKLYGANLKKNKEGKYTHKLFPFLLCSFPSSKDAKFNMPNRLKNRQYVMGLGNLKFNVHGQDACPRLQLTSKYNLPTAGWISFKGTEILNDEDKFTRGNTREFLVDLSDKRYKPEELICRSEKTTVPKPLILSFDLEVNSEDGITMPKATRPGDVVFQISCVFYRLGSTKYDKYLLSLGNPQESIVGATTLTYSTEKKLLMGFRDLINEKNPHVITGYNIFSFDIPYLMDRANYKSIYPEWSIQGFPKDRCGIQREIKWSSSAYKNQEFKYLDCEGRLYIDLLPVVQRDFKLNDYKLKTVSTHFIGETKDDLDYKSIFKCYREGIKDNSARASKYMSICGKYCMQDSMLVAKLMEKLNVWHGLSEMAVVCNVPMITLFTKGQQIKVYSNLYKYCLDNKIVPEKDGYTVGENERYVGAYVFDPVPGLYENVVPLDFCVAGDTLVSLGNGLSQRIDKTNHNPTVLAFNPEEEGFLPKSAINGLQRKGEKHTVKVTMKDGREIVCTPDHKFMLANGEWCEAQNLLGQRVKCGVEFPEDVDYGDEEDYSLTVMFESNRTSRLSYYNPIDTEQWNMIDHRDKILAFVRILGFVYADGSIYKSKDKSCGCVEAYVGTKFDVDTFQRDLTLFGCVAGVQFKTGSKGSYYRLNLPANFTRMIHALPGITVDKRTTQPLTFPDFLMEDGIPKSVIREFLAGLFGGDGCAPCVSSNGKTVRRIAPIYFKWDTCFPEEMTTTFKQLCLWLKMFGLNPTINTKIPSKSQFSKEGRTSILICFAIDEVVQYHKSIGFRYCINKSYRLTIISSYLSLRSKVSKQFDDAFRYGLEYLKNVENKSNKYKLVCDHIHEYLKSKIVLNDIVYMTPSKFVNRKIKEETNPNQTYTFKSWLTIDQYLDELEVSQIFDSRASSVSSHHDFVPAFSMEVLDVSDFKTVPVYDIEVENDHNFIANGMVITNCSLYPSLIISYNLDYTTCAFDPSIPDDLCNVMEWEDHIACKHDPKVIRKKELTKLIDDLVADKSKKKANQDLLSKYRKERSDITKSLNKNVMCEKRKYRFLKVTDDHPEFKGVLPNIVQSLLDARKDTRKEMGKLKDKLKTTTDEVERKEIETMVSILNQRQLAYKVSANSMYGITGVKAGMLPFMPVAMSITYKGRENIIKAAEYGKQKFNGQLIYIDTDCLLWSSPIIIRKDDKIFYTTVDEISQGDWKRINPNKEISTPKEGYEVWSDQGFTKIENVVRCKPIESMSRVTTHIGTVVCSDNHSLLTDYLASVTPQDVKIGDKLCVSELPLPADTPKEPQYPNKLTVEKIEEYRLSDYTCSTDEHDISQNLAFIWGLFMADGSCGEYEYKNQLKYSWAINKADTNLLKRVRQLCQSEYNRDFQILDTIESGQCYKLVQCKCNNDFVLDYRRLFYTKDKYKKIPDVILQAPLKIRYAFFMGFYAGDGSKKDPSISITFKGQIGSAQLFYLMRSLGYQVSVNVREDKPDIYKLTGSTPKLKMRKVPNAIKKLTEYKDRGDYIYDIQTSNHHFTAGVGQLVVHNSNYFSFPDINDHTELWDFAIKVAAEISTLFPPPMKLEFEEAIYTKFLILTKKRYMYKSALQDGTIKPEIGKRGVVLNRRDNSAFIRNTYENMVKIIFENTEPLHVLQQKVCSALIDDINLMFTHILPVDDFVITKSTGDYGNLEPQYFQNEKGLHRALLGQYNVPFLTDEIKFLEGITTSQQETDWYLDKLPAHIQLLEKIRRRGQIRNEGSRLEFVIVETNDLKDKQSAKIETLNYFNKNKDILKLDYLYYLSRCINPIDQILDVVLDLKNFMKNHYNERVLKKKLTLNLESMFAPEFVIEKDKLYLIKTSDKYTIVCGAKEHCKQEMAKYSNFEKIFSIRYVPSKDMYSYLQLKYGDNTTLKTKFIFKDNCILLNNLPESKLISTIKRECRD